MKSRQLRCTGNEGLTLIELLVAVVLLTFGVMAAMTVLVQAQSSGTATTAKTMAINAAQQQMELILDDTPANVLIWNNTTFAVGDLVRPGGGPPGLITVAATQPRTITVSVVWQGQGILPAGQVTVTALRSEATR
jgi:type II secretory pathway pseudopilin PulG